LYEAATLRPPGYYTSGDTDRTEYKDGTGSRFLYLDYPIEELTSITLGYSSTELLDHTTRANVVYQVGSRKVTRTDGGWFGSVDQAAYIVIVYDHLGNLPEDARLPIMEVVASMYRSRSLEGMKSETLGSFYSYTLGDVKTAADTNDNWRISVENNRPVVIA
jgi:hypothetical protein